MLISDKLKSNAKLDQLSLYPSFEGKGMNIEITSACNERCIYCSFSASGVHKKVKNIEDDIFYRVTKEAYELGVRDIGLYMTAEPLMNPKIYDYIKYLKEIGFTYVYISTNGILCTPKNLERMIQAGLDSLKFSVSASNSHDFIQHHGVDQYEKVYENIKYAFQYRKENNLNYKLFIFSILTKFNISDKETIKERYEPYVDEIVFSQVNDGIVKIKGLSEYLSLDDKTGYLSDAARCLPCAQLFNKIIVDENGFLCSCCYAGVDYTKIADLHHMSLKEAVYCEDFVNIRKKHLENNIENTICNRCINGVIETIYPLTEKYNFKAVDVPDIEYTEEIRKRFNIID